MLSTRFLITGNWGKRARGKPVSGHLYTRTIGDRRGIMERIWERVHILSHHSAERPWAKRSEDRLRRSKKKVIY